VKCPDNRTADEKEYSIIASFLVITATIFGAIHMLMLSIKVPQQRFWSTALGSASKDQISVHNSTGIDSKGIFILMNNHPCRSACRIRLFTNT